MDTPNYGGFWWRFLASFLDGLLLQLVSCPIGLLIGIPLGVIMGVQQVEMEEIKTIVNLVSGIFGLVLQWLYSALMESSVKQATLGKMICRLKVTDLNGEPLTFARATGRHFAKYVSSFTCMVGYIMAAFTERKQALHDMIAGTLVIKE